MSYHILLGWQWIKVINDNSWEEVKTKSDMNTLCIEAKLLWASAKAGLIWMALV